jgi:hydrogenase maturation protease
VTNDPATPTPGHLLVIGYGNDLRSDDGVGPKVAAAVAKWDLPGVCALACHQLTPELAETISSARQVIFVDGAADSSGPVQIREIQTSDSGQTMTHSADPRALLALAQQVFGRCPPALWLTIPVENLGFGEELSATAREGVQMALDRIRKLVG